MPLNDLSSLNDLSAQPMGTPQPQAQSQTTAAPASTPTAANTGVLSGKLAQITTILLGLIFIVAGLFSFKSVREVTVKAGETATRVAAAAA